MTRRFIQWAQNVPFSAIAVLTTVLYAAVCVFYNVHALHAPRVNREIFVWPVALGLMLSYGVGAVQITRQKISTKPIVWFAMAMALLALLTPPFHSTDLYGYINRGWEQAHYGMNPYVYPVDSIPNWHSDPMLTSHWSTNPSPYAFLFVQLAKWLCIFGGGNFVRTVFLFKLINFFAYAATGVLLYCGAKKLEGINPATVLYLFLWNPLILIHHIYNGHNDLLMGFLITLALYCAIAGKSLWLLPAAMAATLIKYAPVVIFPIAVFYLARQRRWADLCVGLALSVLLLVLCAWPYMADWHQFQISTIEHNAFVSANSLPALIFDSYKQLEHLMPILHEKRLLFWSALRDLLLAGYVAFYVVSGLRCLKREFDLRAFLEFSVLMLMLLIGVVSFKFYPWYIGIFLPVALLLPPASRLRRVSLWVSVFQVLSITFIGQAQFLNVILMTLLPLALAWRQPAAIETAPRV